MRQCSAYAPRLVARAIGLAVSIAMAMPLQTLPLRAQDAPPAAAPPAATDADQASEFSSEQLDALLAPIALYPDALLTQILMAATEPLQIVQAKRWLDDPAHGALKGDALTQALASQNWDPSVKSLVPFPQVLDMLNSKLDWTQQLGYAFATQQADVLDSVQRLRRQAQAAGHLESSPQLTVAATESQAITIEPTNPQVVFVPTYNPTQVFGPWPYPAFPPVVLPPPPGYAVGTALATGLAFGAGVAITAGLWNLARPNWGWRGPGYGGVNVNVNRWNSVNVNRPPLNGNNWRPPPSGRPGGWNAGRPPSGPVGRPVRQNGVPPGAIGRPSVPVNRDLVNRPTRPTGSPPPLQRPGGGGGPQRPGGGGSGGGGGLPQRPGGGGGGAGPQRPGGGAGNLPQRPGGGGGGGGAPQRPGAGGNLPQRPGGGGGAPQRPGGGGGAQRPPVANRPAARPGGNGGGAFGGMNQGRQANQFAARGGQSRGGAPAARPGGGGGRPGGGGGGFGGGARGGGGGHGGGGRHR
jgi:hypothetical protein